MGLESETMIDTRKLVYTESGTEFVGSLSQDRSTGMVRPGVLVLPTFRGLTEFEIGKAEALATLGYTALAVDMYGGGRSTDGPEKAREMMNELNADRRLLLRRIEAAVTALGAERSVDSRRMAAIGFCFGGKCVLDLARSGAEIGCVVSFHGVYDPPPFESDAVWKASVLVLHGWDDPLNPPELTTALADEMTARDADWQILSYGATGHAFTNPLANSPESGMAFNPLTNVRSWKAMRDFLKEALG